MSLLTDTKEIQTKLGSYCRDAVELSLPGLTKNRLPHYRRLVFNIIQDNLQTAYPIAHKYLLTEHWEKMVFEFFKEHKCQSTQIWKMPREFKEYVLAKDFANGLNLPFLNDLLTFEWIETELFNMEDMELKPYKEATDLLNEVLVINPEHKIISLEYPVHVMKPLEAKEHKGKYFVLIYRELDKGKVQFIDLSIWFAFALEQSTRGKTLQELLQFAPQLFGEKVNLEELRDASLKFYKELSLRRLILGKRV